CALPILEQAAPGRGGKALGQPARGGAVRLVVLHDHRLPRHARDGRGDLPPDRGLPRQAGLLRDAGRQLRNRRDRRVILALRRSRLGLHLCILLSLVGRNTPWRRKDSSTPSPSTSGSGGFCSSSVSFPTWWTTWNSRECCDGR